MLDLSGIRWRKSSRSDQYGGDCVEVAAVRSAVAVRDSKDLDGPKIIVNQLAFGALINAVHTGTHDLA
ncbi:DUF397 domain-containing protein [Actinomadura atramentaria]|uniref:DUF397 domain-containing protein n=1 Tax=Actinomadura atramentaria TaxID=1990 RepID=UPI00037A714D|nr:DUF397 domain-containing protein [Actinomadura atramentaria]